MTHGCVEYILSFPFGLFFSSQTSYRFEDVMIATWKECYARMVCMCHARSWKLYKYRPKWHLVCHIVRSLQNEDGDVSLNPRCSLVLFGKKNGQGMLSVLVLYY